MRSAVTPRRARVRTPHRASAGPPDGADTAPAPGTAPGAVIRPRGLWLGGGEGRAEEQGAVADHDHEGVREPAAQVLPEFVHVRLRAVRELRVEDMRGVDDTRFARRGSGRQGRRLPAAGDVTRRAPWARICSVFSGDVPSGTYTVHGGSARARYAAADVPALPLLSATTRPGFSRRAGSASITAPRSSKESVGIRWSSLAEPVSVSGTSAGVALAQGELGGGERQVLFVTPK
ncbi:hypothetical protein EES46_09905 [Streptomyces sp. ADI98-10]|nr:hypothetical protein EES46_09905 [Streptomyces sp. ADI98-10]